MSQPAPGVTQVGAVEPPVAAPVQAPAAVQFEEGGEAPGGSLNALEIGAGIVIMTCFFFAVYFFRVKTYKTNTDVTDLKGRVVTLETKDRQQQQAA